MTAPSWVFGYGSLIWRQDFPFLEARDARLSGWMRRLWQGSHDHRGTPEDPGRVATLVAQAQAHCIGRAFLVAPEVFEHLDYREKNGYSRLRVPLDLGGDAVAGVTYVGHPDNPAFLGDAPLADVVKQVRRCVGESGSNVEYVVELDRALREMGAPDAHIAAIASQL
ncbi:MAG: gamma-glutamylcyclotransferase [Pseudomonadota bacterium]